MAKPHLRILRSPSPRCAAARTSRQFAECLLRRLYPCLASVESRAAAVARAARQSALPPVRRTQGRHRKCPSPVCVAATPISQVFAYLTRHDAWNFGQLASCGRLVQRNARRARPAEPAPEPGQVSGDGLPPSKPSPGQDSTGRAAKGRCAKWPAFTARVKQASRAAGGASR
jgi:hypothetical protein